MRLATCLYEEQQRLARAEGDDLVLLPVDLGTSLRTLMADGKLEALRHAGGDVVSVDRVRFLHPRGWSYYATLRGKLHWASGVE